MSNLQQRIRISAAYTRSINLARDRENSELVRAYVLTSRARQALTQIAAGLGKAEQPRALALIGPYGSGKSAFGLFLSALLAADSSAHPIAMATLQAADPELAERFRWALAGGRRGFLRVPINGLPDSLTRQLLLGLTLAAEQNGLTQALVSDLRAAAEPGTPMDRVLELVDRVQTTWSGVEGAGVLLEIDELGKFLEYESYHPQHREIHLLQLLAEHAAQAHHAPLHLVVFLHQSFEHYGHRLGRNLRDEWRKVQGRFEAIAFLEPADQALRVIAAAFEATPCENSSLDEAQRNPGCPGVARQVDDWVAQLAAEGALPPGLEQREACALLDRCYPLHPLTLLILPVLCQKVAQNERTLFSYLGGREPFGFRERLAVLQEGEWIEPWALYDYFILNQSGELADPVTYRRWMEVITALERFAGPPDDPAVRLLKTIGLLNLIGAQRGLKASRPILALLFGEALPGLLERLEQASLIHFRQYNQEYRIWQGSDFDLRAALEQAVAEQAGQSLVDVLNALEPLKPVVARRVTIHTGTLRSLQPGFTSPERWPPRSDQKSELRLWFYLDEQPKGGTEWLLLPEQSASAGELSVVAACGFTERLSESVGEWLGLRELPHRHAALNGDPVAQREHRAWLTYAEADARQLLDALLQEPEALRWFWSGEERAVRNRRDWQRQLSVWIDQCYPLAPLLRNELINWDRPSASAHTGRKRLLAAMLSAADQEDLGIARHPAEKSLYLSLLKASRLHRQEGERWGFYPPADDDPCLMKPVWDILAQLLGGDGQRQAALLVIYDRLRAPPYGIKQGVLPVLIVAYLLAHRREVALYQEGGFCEEVTMEQVELLCRRPELFALERFDLGGFRGELFTRYLDSIVGRAEPEASLLDIVRPLMRFLGGLPEYTVNAEGLTERTQQVRVALQQAKSPGVLLFEALPRACGVAATDLAKADPAVIEEFVQRLSEALRELKGAYGALLEGWRLALGRALLDQAPADLADLRRAVAERYAGLERYTPDRLGVGALIRRLTDRGGHNEDEAWLESVATLLGRMPPRKWREEHRLQAELRLRELGEQLRDLEKLAARGGRDDALLVKVVDGARGEISRVVRLSSGQRAAAARSADQVAEALAGLDESARLAVIATLLERFAGPEQEGRDGVLRHTPIED